LVHASLLDRDRLISAMRHHQVSAVVHFAASAYVGDSIKDPAAYYRNNLITTLSLLDAMRAGGVSKMLFSSSCSVYGNPVRVPIDESHPTAPLSPYGQTKLDGENAIKWYARAYGIDWTALRYFNAAGADPTGELGEVHDPETRLVPRAIMAALGTLPPLEIYGTDYPTQDGTAIRDYIHVTDLAAAHVLALQAVQKRTASDVFNLGTGAGYSVLDVVRAVEAVSGRTVPRVLRPRRDGDPSEVVADASRANERLKWYPQHSSLSTIVRTAWHWHTTAKGCVAA
jgi:UDP-arabinose 4-epimerase